MNDKEISRLVAENSSAEKQSISTATGLVAAKNIIPVAENSGVKWMLAGGIAIHLYGFLRATADVDFIASKLLPLESQGRLSFGGESYLTEAENRSVTVYWIVRDDEQREFYEQALADAIHTDDGLWIISPEWLVIIKFLASRVKDKLDLIWLLQVDNLVNRELLVTHLRNVLGKKAAFFVIPEFQSEFDYADLLKMRERRRSMIEGLQITSRTPLF